MSFINVTARRGAAVVAALAVLAAAAAPADAARLTRRAQASASGQYAVITATATVDRPRQIQVRVTSNRRQRADINWSMVCTQGFGAGLKDGDATRRLPARLNLRFPARPSRLSSCTVSALAQIGGSGRVTVAIWARRR